MGIGDFLEKAKRVLEILLAMLTEKWRHFRKSPTKSRDSLSPSHSVPPLSR
jgi:hypothetical protein